MKNTTQLFASSCELKKFQEAINALEDEHCGALRFATFGYGWGLELHIENWGWKRIDKFRELPGLSELADELNTAMKPILEKYAQFLRQEMANEAIKLASYALKTGESGEIKA